MALLRRCFLSTVGLWRSPVVMFVSERHAGLQDIAWMSALNFHTARQSCSCTNSGTHLPPWAAATRKPPNGCPAEPPDHLLPPAPLGARANSNDVSSDHSLCDLTYGELMSALEFQKKIHIIDVRQPEEVSETGMMPGAFNVPLDELEKALQMPSDSFSKRYNAVKPAPPGAGIIFSCRRGRRSRMALDIAHKAGYTMSKHYIGGWDEYATKQGKPVTKDN